MEKYPSKISKALEAHLVRSFVIFFVVFLFLKFVFNINFSLIHIGYYILFTVCYILLTYIYLAKTNTDFIVLDDRIEMVNNLPFFKKKTVLPFNEIKSIVFRHEWTESLQEKIKPRTLGFIITEYLVSAFFPYDYKWIKFTTDRSYTFLCFGLEFDYFDNNDEALIEGLFYKLAACGIDVRWTNIKLNYYAGMMRNINPAEKNKSK